MLCGGAGNAHLQRPIKGAVDRNMTLCGAQNIVGANQHHRILTRSRCFTSPSTTIFAPTLPYLMRRPPRCSFIRKAMVSTMFRTMQERNPGIPGYSGGFFHDGEEGERQEGAMVPMAGGRREDGFATESKIESAAAACVLWSTIGIGCLVGGRPKSSVSQPRRCFCSGGVHDWVCHLFVILFAAFLVARVLALHYPFLHWLRTSCVWCVMFDR